MIDEADFHNRIKTIKWEDFYTAYGKAIDIPNQLIRLASSNHKDAMDASHDLWCGLCHQHAYISSAAFPALPFILEILDYANEELTVEILDILLGFSFCTSPEYLKGCIGEIPDWEYKLRENLQVELPHFYSLKESKNGDIADFASRIIEEFEK